uniref:Uncharacterized protein n=1 Tax=Oryza sativa subsp. japonica TaxID=39947 RepID=Q6K8V4_ORYSJ|nr:hypothetical protein [Oryza sativa Japonica Group]
MSLPTSAADPAASLLPPSTPPPRRCRHRPRTSPPLTRRLAVAGFRRPRRLSLRDLRDRRTGEVDHLSGPPAKIIKGIFVGMPLKRSQRVSTGEDDIGESEWSPWSWKHGISLAWRAGVINC